MINRHFGGVTRPRRIAGRGAIAALVLLSAACDTEVVNPGPVTDTFLSRQEAHQALANGAKVMLADALAYVSYTTAAVTREIFPAGSTSAFGISARQQAGRLEFDDEHILPPWQSQQRSRNIGESAIVRFQETVPNLAGYRPAAEAALWTAYAYRMLGEVSCQAVINGGPAQAHTVFLEHAETWFDRAIEYAGSAHPTIATAARAGRASVRMNRGNWQGAVADASSVSNNDFVFNMEYTNTQTSQFNRLYYASANRPYRAHTVWNTFYHDYYLETNDPRTPHFTPATEMTGDAALGILGGARAPWFPQTKLNQEAAPIRLSSGWEMRLIEAEALLTTGDWQAALPLINGRRVALNLDPWAASSLAEAWTVYKRERGIELWLEGRRIGDLRRWAANNAPGELHPLETAGHASSYLRADQTLCYPLPRAEYETNTNLTQP
jgi:starch-binding outer membrane protein, SusD/RagB family